MLCSLLVRQSEELQPLALHLWKSLQWVQTTLTSLWSVMVRHYLTPIMLSLLTVLWGLHMTLSQGMATW